MRRRNKKGTGTGIIVFVVLCIFGVVAFGITRLQDRKDKLAVKEESLEKKMEEEEERSEEIKELEAYVQTKKYIEKIAREQLGLVYEDEILIMEEDK